MLYVQICIKHLDNGVIILKALGEKPLNDDELHINFLLHMILVHEEA